MAGKAYLGIDAGTSVVKAAIFDENGDALAVQGRSAHGATRILSSSPAAMPAR